MNRQTKIAAAVLVGIAVVYVVFIRKTDEDRIRAQLRALSAAVREAEGENQILRAARIEREFPHIFTKEVTLHVPMLPEGRTPRHELATLAIGAAKKASKIELRWSDVRVEVDRPMARAFVTGAATGAATRRDGGDHLESRSVTLRFEREEDEWRIADVAVGER